MPRLLRVGVLALAAGSLAACNTARGPSARAPATSAFTALDGQAQRAPLVSLPDAGRPVLVDEVRYPGGLRQQIRFGRDGGSRADLTLGAPGISGGPAMGRPTKQGIAAELASLRDGPYRVLTRPTRNAYGPVGVAVGGRCAFAWQWIEDVRGIEIGAGRTISGAVSASLRVHHCGRPGATDALLADLTRLRLGPVSAEQASRPARRRTVRNPPAAPPEAATAPVLVPPVASQPLVTVNGSRTLIDLPPERAAPALPTQSASPIIAVPRPGAPGTDKLVQSRYLSDPPEARPSVALDAPPPRPPARQEALSPNLPPQAYRGPAPPPFGW